MTARKGVLANLSALNALQTTDNNAYNYITTIRGWFDTMMGGSSPTPDPFFITLSPMPAQYCAP